MNSRFLRFLSVYIADPVAGATYILNPHDRTGQKLALNQLHNGAMARG